MKNIFISLFLLLQVSIVFAQWENVSPLTGTYTISDIITYNNALYCACDSGVYKSSNMGANWSKVFEPLSSPAVYELLADGNTIYAVCAVYGLYKSTDNGSNWAPCFNGETGWLGTSITKINDRIYFTAHRIWNQDRFFYTTNGGINWTETFLDKEGKVYSNNNGYLYVYRSDTLFKTSNYGGTWSFAAFQPGAYYYSIMANANEVYYSAYNSIYRSTDFGSNFSQTNIIASAISFDKINNVVFAGTNLQGFYYTTDNGLNWVQKNEGLSAQPIVSTINIHNNYLFIGAEYIGLWRRPLSDFPVLFSVSGLVKYQDNNLPVTGGYVKALKFDWNLNRVITVDSASINIDGTYTLPKCPPDSLDIMAYQDDELDYVPTYHNSTIDWRAAETVLPVSNLTNINVSVYRISNNSSYVRKISGRIYASGETDANTYIKDACVYARNNENYRNYSVSGSDGSYIIDSLPPGEYSLIVNRFGYNPKTRIVNLSNSDLQSIDIDLGSLLKINNTSIEIPVDFSLHQNYPNPFNPTTHIGFQILDFGLATLRIYDILGNEIETLVNEQLKPGTYEVTFNASNYSSGIYYYRLVAGNYSAAKKMVLIK